MKLRLPALVLALTLPVACAPARADRADDLVQMTDMDYCSTTADMVVGGITSEIAGHKREIRNASAAILEMAEHGIPLPKDAMYVQGWNKMTEHEQEFMKQFTFLGYDQAATNPGLTDEEGMKLAQKYFEACMYQRTKEKHSSSGYLIHAASSQGLNDPEHGKEMECLHEANGAYQMINEVRKGIPKDKWFTVFPIPSGFSVDATERIQNVVAGAYEWKGTPKEYAHQVYQDCKENLE